MSLSHTFTCDRCESKVRARYNGEHYLPPSGWRQLYDPIKARCDESHLCEICLIQIFADDKAQPIDAKFCEPSLERKLPDASFDGVKVTTERVSFTDDEIRELQKSEPTNYRYPFESKEDFLRRVDVIK